MFIHINMVAGLLVPEDLAVQRVLEYYFESANQKINYSTLRNVFVIFQY